MILTSSWIVDCLLISITIIFLLYKYFTRHFDYWKNRGVRFPKPVPFFGNFYDANIFRTTVPELLKRYCDEIEDPYYGVFIFDEPVLVVQSPELVKDILIKDFSVFSDRRVARPSDPSITHGVFFLKYHAWKPMRIKLSPIFSSGMLKNVHTHLVKINEIGTDFLNKNIGIVYVDVIGERFASEILARSIYGVNGYSFEQEISPMRKNMKQMFEFTPRNAFIQIMYFIRPSLINFLKLNVISSELINFFKTTFRESMNSRASYTGKPRDMLDLANIGLKAMQEGQPNAFEIDMAVSNAILFLLAGYDNIKTFISFTLYELAMNQDIQNKLREEIKANIKEYGEISFEGIKKNKYLEMCIYETIRKYPALPFLGRTARSDYRLQGTNLTIKKGTSVIIPLFALHRNEKYFPNADKYDPERFENSDFNKDGLTFIPFGEGPRNCSGQKMGYLFLATVLANIIMKFKLEKCDQTPEKPQFDPKSFTFVSKVGLPLKLSPVETIV